jgi:hypothetical protein
MMKIFIQTSELSEKSPRVMAWYSEDSPINFDTHGPGMTMYVIPEIAFNLKDGADKTDPFPRLPEDWKDRYGKAIVEWEAQRRVNEAMTPAEQMTTLREALELLTQYGPNLTVWPAAAKSRKAEIDEAWNYVREVNARARSFASMPPNPYSDKNWPTRPAKKV